MKMFTENFVIYFRDIIMLESFCSLLAYYATKYYSYFI